MIKILAATWAMLVIGLTAASAIHTPAKADWVRGHYRGNGTYVAPYYRTPADGNPYNNLRGY